MAEDIIELEDCFEEDADATEYSIGVSVDDGLIRIRFHNVEGLLSSFVTDSSGAYDLARRILRGYDELEGIR